MAPRNKKTQSKSETQSKTRLLIDASQNEETRVAVVKRNRLDDFEVESLVRKQIKGNIYLAKVTRVEPSLQAAFVNYGGNRHGFLPFSEIHPDYYRIPVADRERLMAEQEELERQAAEEAARIAEEEDRKAEEEELKSQNAQAADTDDNIEEIEDEEEILEAGAEAEISDENAEDEEETQSSDEDASDHNDDDTEEETNAESQEDNDEGDESGQEKSRGRGRGRYRNRRGRGRRYSSSRNRSDRIQDDDEDLTSVEPFWKRIRRAYKIQEVIKRGQIMLIQVGKEERGNKGAAVTTYITLPGRYSVLMPNTPQSGGVSRKISNYKDRKRMRDILKDLNVPDGMSVILRTAGTSRTKADIKRDLDYLMRLWNSARDLTLKSTAPSLINEEGSLIKRAIRDIYNKDISEVIVSGDEGYKAAREMMKMLMPSHVKKITQYKETTPLFIAENLETQIEAMHSPQVELKSGGYLVINPTEALVSIDVNSGRATKERNIEDTALKTNIEAAEEIARQLKLRDLGGLVVIDFIDMENRRYNGRVEKAMREALSTDRARIQVGRISSFGLMEMSRQRLHPSLTEAHFEPCPHCFGMGIVKTVDTMALTILRAIEHAGLKQGDSIVTVIMAPEVALYLLNHHRTSITDLENRYGLTVQIEVGLVKEEARYSLNVTAKPKPSDDHDEDDDESNDDIAESSEAVEENNKAKKSQRNNKRRDRQRSRSKDRKDSDNTPDEKESISDDQGEKASEEQAEITKKDDQEVVEKPKKKRGRPAAKKKIEIEEVAAPDTDQQPRDENPEAINDNGDDDSVPENTAARDAETVNETPKTKKKGWWNKITS